MIIFNSIIIKKTKLKITENRYCVSIPVFHTYFENYKKNKIMTSMHQIYPKCYNKKKKFFWRFMIGTSFLVNILFTSG